MGKQRKDFWLLSKSSQRRHKAKEKKIFFQTFGMDSKTITESYSMATAKRSKIKLHSPAIRQPEKLENACIIENNPTKMPTKQILECSDVQQNVHCVTLVDSEMEFCKDVNCTKVDEVNYSEEEDKKSNHDSFGKKLVEILLQDNVKDTTCTKILQCFRQHFPDSNFPLHAKTFLGKPRRSGVSTMGHGKYVHFGMENVILDFLSKRGIDNVSKIEVQLATDGIPIYNGNNMQLWPILGRIMSTEKVFVIGCFCGPSKPENSNDFLSSTVNDFIKFHETGFVYMSKKIQVVLHSLICDIPAKSMVLMTKGHSGYNSCTKCKVKGEYHGRVCFPTVEFELRTDEEIEKQTDGGHHHARSILLSIPGFSFLKNVPFDYMHLIVIGMTKKLLSLWLSTAKNDCLDVAVKILLRDKANVVNQFLELLADYCPHEFRRKIVDVKSCGNWKATQFRLFLLYIGPVALRIILSKDDPVYVNFLCLHCAVRLLSLPAEADVIEYAESLLKIFVTQFVKLYGARYASANVHGLLHIAADVRNLGPLDTFSAFKYENYLRFLKVFANSSTDKPLESFTNKYLAMEKNGVDIYSVESSKIMGPSIQIVGGPIPNDVSFVTQYSKCQFKNFFLTITVPDNCCMINNDFVVIENFVEDREKKVFAVGRRYMNRSNFFHVPCPSSILKIFSVHKLSSLMFWEIDKVTSKCMRLPVHDSKNAFVVIPLLHTSLENDNCNTEE